MTIMDVGNVPMVVHTKDRDDSHTNMWSGQFMLAWVFIVFVIIVIIIVALMFARKREDGHRGYGYDGCGGWIKEEFGRINSHLAHNREMSAIERLAAEMCGKTNYLSEQMREIQKGVYNQNERTRDNSRFSELERYIYKRPHLEDGRCG